jgi:GT2 family glycosyltransferase
MDKLIHSYVMAKVIIIIIGFRRSEDVVLCLEKLRRMPGPDFDVHICENGGDASYAMLVKDLSAVKSGQLSGLTPVNSILETRVTPLDDSRKVFVHRASGNLGYAGGINAVLDVTANSADWKAVWVLNPDTEPAPDALLALQNRAEEGGYGMVGSRIVLKHSDLIQMYGGRWRQWIAKGKNIGLGEPSSLQPDVDLIERQMDYICGASMYVTRAFVESVGRMEEGYFLYAEEVDWCFRRGDFKLGYAHDSIVYHAHGATIGSHHDRRSRSSFSVFLDERSRLLITRRFFPWRLPIVAMTTFAVATQQYLLVGAIRNYAAALAGWFDGLLGKKGFPRRFLPPGAA